MLVRVRVGKCGMEDVGERVSGMNGGLEGMKVGKEFKWVEGWIGRREVRGGGDGCGEGEFERVMMVGGGMVKGDE